MTIEARGSSTTGRSTPGTGSPRETKRGGSGFVVTAATDADRGEVTQLIREMIPGIAADQRLAWLYANNPAGRALTWIAREDGEVAGCTSYLPWRLQLDGRPVLCALGADGYVRPKFRRRGLGGIMHTAARDDMQRAGIACMYGAPGAMNVTPLKHGGSREVGQVARWVRPLRGVALGISQPPFDRLAKSVLKPRWQPALEPMVRDDSRVDEVWAKFSPTVALAAIRDARFYTWRFMDGPAQKQHAFVIVDRVGRAIGACALEVMDEGAVLRILDLMAIPGQWNHCLTAIARWGADETDCRHVDIKLMAVDGRRRSMWRAGFLERDAKPFLAVIPVDGGDRRFLDPQRWFYSGADSDLDSFEHPSVS